MNRSVIVEFAEKALNEFETLEKEIEHLVDPIKEYTHIIGEIISPVQKVWKSYRFVKEQNSSCFFVILQKVLFNLTV
jgi:hypothetical protein